MNALSSMSLAELLRRGEQIGDELVEIGKELFARGEVHEARHTLAALKAGDTTDCTEDCPLHFGNPVLTISPFEEQVVT